MTPQLVTYLICLITFGYLAFEFYTYRKNTKNGYGYSFRIFYLIAALIVFLTSLVAILTGQTYDELMQAINAIFL